MPDTRLTARTNPTQPATAVHVAGRNRRRSGVYRHRRPMLGRRARHAARIRRLGARIGRATAPRRCIQAAHVAVRVPWTRSERALEMLAEARDGNRACRS